MVPLTNGVDELEVNVERDKRDRQKSEVEFQHTGDRVDIVVALDRNIRLLAICRHKSSLL